jgi:hypothetical protein
MSRGFHEQCNTTLRTAMADLFDFGDGWTLLGCFADGESLVWRPLTTIAEAISAPLHQAADDAGIDRLFGPVLTSGFADAPPEELRHLRGIAEVHYNSSGQGRTGTARAVFDDAWWHTVTWRSAEAAPAWALISPPEVAASALADDRVLPGLLTAMLHKQGLGHRCVSDEQREASTRLRDLLAELVAAGLHTVFVIFRSDQGWEAIPVNDLAARVGAKVAAGMSVVNAVGELAAEVEADPPAQIPALLGVGTIVHYDNDDGSSHASLVAVCDQTLHAAAWIHGQDRPDWQILPVAAADPDYWLMSLAYTQLTEAIRGTSR